MIAAAIPARGNEVYKVVRTLPSGRLVSFLIGGTATMTYTPGEIVIPRIGKVWAYTINKVFPEISNSLLQVWRCEAGGVYKAYHHCPVSLYHDYHDIPLADYQARDTTQLADFTEFWQYNGYQEDGYDNPKLPFVCETHSDEIVVCDWVRLMERVG